MSAQKYRREREREREKEREREREMRERERDEREREEKKQSTTQSVLQVNTEVRLADVTANTFGRQKHGANASEHLVLASC